MAEESSYIELEPKTLNFQEIQSAREAALYVLRTKSFEEALQIFTQGLEPVKNLQGRSHNEVQETSMESEESDFDDDDDEDDEEESYTYSLLISHGFQDVSI